MPAEVPSAGSAASLAPLFAPLAERGPDPLATLRRLASVSEAQPQLSALVEERPELAWTLVAVCATSPALARTCRSTEEALGVLADLEARQERPVGPRLDASALLRWKELELLRVAARDLSGLDGLEEVGANLAMLASDVLQAALELAGVADHAVVGMGKLGGEELNYASDIDLMLVAPRGGADEVGVRRALDLARNCFRIDLGLRPEGRAGPLVRSVAAYVSYWQRWALPWEFQALLKGRPVAGDPELGRAFASAADEALWGRTWGADELRQLRSLKARTEEALARRGLEGREVKRGRGGIRDIEFSVQLLQLVHGRHDPALRCRGTLAALAELDRAGYVAADDAAALASDYRFLRTVEHRLQLEELAQTHVVPEDPEALARLARGLAAFGRHDDAGLRGESQDLRAADRDGVAAHMGSGGTGAGGTARSATPETSGSPSGAGGRTAPGAATATRAPVPGAGRGGAQGPAGEFLALLRFHQHRTRGIYERLYFRPLLDAFAALDKEGTWPPRMTEAAASERLRAFGFADAARTREALAELTRGLGRVSRLMAQLLPLLLAWLADSPDPDLALLGLRRLAGSTHRRERLVTTCRDSPEAARRLCLLLGTSRLLLEGLEAEPDLLPALADDAVLRPRTRAELLEAARHAVAGRSAAEAARVLRRLHQRARLRVAAAAVLGLVDTAASGAALAAAAEATLQVAAEVACPGLDLGIVAMGRFGGAELSLASDVDILFVHAGGDQMSSDRPSVRRSGEDAGCNQASRHRDGGPTGVPAADMEEAAAALVRFCRGPSPTEAVLDLDLDLRPEGRQGPLARSLAAFEEYFSHWAAPWERQAYLRARMVVGSDELAARFAASVERFVFANPLSSGEIREIRRLKARMERERVPRREDPEFHLKLGRGSLSDVEWTVQLLQLERGLPGPATLSALAALEERGALGRAEATALRESYLFCEATRDRLFLVLGEDSDALPSAPERLARLARSLDRSPTELREEYRRVTRRARRVMEDRFYGSGPGGLPRS